MGIKINFNQVVKVKLKDEAVNILKNSHDKKRKYMIAYAHTDIGDFDLKFDKEGYYSCQLWELIRDFNDKFNIVSENIFEENSFIIDVNLQGGNYYVTNE